eukprot:8444100-Pyramimonas_sp.AAC.1
MQVTMHSRTLQGRVTSRSPLNKSPSSHWPSSALDTGGPPAIARGSPKHSQLGREERSGATARA